MSVTVSNIVIKDISPKVDPALDKYLPKTLFPKRIEFELSNVSNAVSNAIRRTVECELLVIAMFAEYADVTCDDIFIIPEMILRRLRMIPINQKTPIDAVFELEAVNLTPDVRDVKSGEITITRGNLKKLPFNETFTLFTLNPGKSIKITNIGIHSAYGFVAGDGMHVLAVNAASVALDQTPINTYEPNGGGGIPSRISNPREWKVSFNTNGSMPPKSIVVAACDSITARVQSVQDLLYSIENNGDEYVLTIHGESHTIGNLFMRTIHDMFPDIRAVTYSSSNITRTCTLRIRCDEDINTIYNTTIRHLVRLFADIKKHFE